MEALLARHRKEQKELQGKITSKKKNATKKTRKGVNDECERLEQVLKEQQRAEIEALAPATLEEDVSKLDIADDTRDLEEDVIGDTSAEGSARNHSTLNGVSLLNEAHEDPQTTRKPNRQKARLARRAMAQEAQIEAAAEEAANMPDQRQQELASMKQQMDSYGLVETVIRPDGHCLYSACASCLPTPLADYRSVRLATANYINTHSDDFAPFMEEPIDTYTRKIRDTAEWGGHLELQAIAKAFGTNINILQASGQVEKIQPGLPSDKHIWLAYYKHSFGLGEHYNALKKASAG